MNENEQCHRDGCGHVARHHAQDANVLLHCRVTGCACTEFITAEQAKPKAKPTSRRVCFDVPDGYSIGVSIFPSGPTEATDPDDAGAADPPVAT